MVDCTNSGYGEGVIHMFGTELRIIRTPNGLGNRFSRQREKLSLARMPCYKFLTVE